MAKRNRKNRARKSAPAPLPKRWAPGDYLDGRIRVVREPDKRLGGRNDVLLHESLVSRAHFMALEPSWPPNLVWHGAAGDDHAGYYRLAHLSRGEVTALEAYLDALSGLIGRLDAGDLKSNDQFMTVPVGRRGRYEVLGRDLEAGVYAVAERLEVDETPSGSLARLACGKRDDGAWVVPGWNTKKLRNLMNASERGRRRAREPFCEADLPETGFVSISVEGAHATVSFAPGADVTMGLERERERLIRLAASLFRKARPSGGCTTQSHKVEARFSGAEKAKLANLVRRADEALGDAVQAPLHPLAVEELLGLDRRERALWRDEGRLKPVAYETVRRNGVSFDVPYYDRAQVAAITRADVTAWRAERARTKAENRKAAGRKAAESRKRNERARVDERNRVDALAREVAKEAGDLSAVEAVRLSILAAMASRLAKSEARKASSAKATDRLYDLKTRALETLARTALARLSFVPGPHRHTFDFCDSHREEYRDERALCGGELPGRAWGEDNIGRLRKCPDCRVTTRKDHYALYETAIETASFRIALHTPYPVGRERGWPDKSELPKATPRDQEEGMFRYGRPAQEDERLLYPQKRLEAEVEQSIARLERVLPARTGEAHAGVEP